MDQNQKRNAFRTAETIAENLVYAWNYCATLRALQRHAPECPHVLDTNGHFFSTLTFAL
jgi:VanZ family protein